MNVLVVERGEHKLLVTIPNFFAIEREDFALQPFGDAFLDEEIH